MKKTRSTKYAPQVVLAGGVDVKLGVLSGVYDSMVGSTSGWGHELWWSHEWGYDSREGVGS